MNGYATSERSGYATTELGPEGIVLATATATAPSPPRWPSLTAEREAVAALTAQSQAIRLRFAAIVAEAKTRLGVAEETPLDIHLATGLWFRVGDPVPAAGDSVPGVAASGG